MHRVIALVGVVCVTGCAIPARDNPHDPTNLAEPSFSVSVDGANSATGSRGSSWVFDAAETTGETGGSCFEWALSREAVDDPSASSTTWDELEFVDETAVSLPMPLDPARTTLELKATDFVDPDGVITARAGCDSVRADVLTTVWAYSSGTGHLRRLDTSQFLNPFNETNQGVFASDGSRMLIVEEVGANVRPHLMKRGFSLEASSPTSTTNFDLTTVAATWDGNDGWWVQNGENGSLRHYNASMLVDRTFTTVALEGDAVDFDFTAFQAAVVRGPGTDAWVIGGDRIGNTFNTTGQRLFRVKTDGTVVIRMPAHTDAGAVATRLAPDGQGGVWVSADGSPRVPHVASSGTVATPPLDLTGTGCEGGVAELAHDETRNVLWLGVYGAESPLLCRVGRPDGSFIPQRVDTLGTLVVDASDGTALMIANDGDGISRYDGASVESIDYIPMNPQFRAKKMDAAGGNLAVWLENKTLVGQSRMAVIEGGEIFVPNNVVLDVDPYLFDEVSHATDPVTGFAWVWHPDDSKIAAYAYGERIFEQYLPGMAEQRVRLALDPDARRLYVAWSSLYTGNGVDPPAIGRLLYMDLTGDFSPMTLNTAAGIEISILRGIGVRRGVDHKSG